MQHRRQHQPDTAHGCVRHGFASGGGRDVAGEAPDELLTQPQELRDGYLAALQRFQERLKQCCQRNQVELLENGSLWNDDEYRSLAA